MRSDVPRWNWLKCTVWSVVALYSSTGMLTSPKLTEPLQIALAMQVRYPVGGGVTRRSVVWVVPGVATVAP
ncbi:hypothetical protein GCM10017774_74320 [Lentzea cavernae]|uniref:Secreted protein n=1 Tax=Lentzea cavernae TaxID=2020703 RepID=A0ABQ3MRJ6_9PSEU|nr:hypothetical protein GCM10017774_74320 [Lentzea cavernae]